MWALNPPNALLRPSLATQLCVLVLVSTMSVAVPTLQFDRTQAVLEGFYTSEGATQPVDGNVVIPLPTPAKPVSLPVESPTRAFWTDSEGANPLAREGAEGELTREADVCVVGAGITGVSAVWHLVKELSGEKEGRSVVILEARDFCSGATGRNGGHLTPTTFLDFRRRQALYGTDEAIRSYKLENHTTADLLSIIRDHGEDASEEVDLVQGGHITLLFTPEEEVNARADFEAAKEAGVEGLEEVKWIDKETMEKTRGTPFPGLWMPGNNLWPLKLVVRLYKLARDHSPNVSVSLHTHTPVTSIESIASRDKEGRGGSRRYEVHTGRGTIGCDYVLHATNGYANYLVDEASTGVRVVPTRGQIVGVRAKEGTEKIGRMGWGANEGFEYWFPRPLDGNGTEEKPLIILGGGRETSGPTYEYYETDDGKLNERVGTTLRRFLPSLFPGLYEDEVHPVWEWTGIMGYTPTGNPFVGRLPSEKDGTPSNQYISAGYTGHGMPRGYACAEAVAGMISSDMRGMVWTPPPWFPLHYQWNRQ